MAARSTGKLPRLVTPSVLWTGGCLPLDYQGEPVHSHFLNYAIRGSTATMLVDTGHPIHWATIERDVEAFLDGRPLDYIFISHGELPHAGLITQWLEKYPRAIAVGDIREYRLYYPEHADRFRIMQAGDSIDLGDRRVVLLPAVWRDLTTTLWAFDTKDKVLFVSDAYGFLHHHKLGQCDLMTSEMPPPDTPMMKYLNERALYWTVHTDVRQSFADLDEVMRRLRPAFIASAHGGVVDNGEAMAPLIKEGMMLTATATAPPQAR